jgi:hypothetical protein
MSENQEININFDHQNLKNKMIKLLNQFENLDEFYRDDIEFGKPTHSRGLRKIYNKMFDILENNYKNLPRELEKYNKNVPKEEKPKIQKITKNTSKKPKNNNKNTDNTSKKNKNLKGGENPEINKNDENISFLTTQKINNNNDNNVKNTNNNIFSKNSSSSVNYNIDDTLISIMDTDNNNNNNNNKEKKEFEEITELIKKLTKSAPNDKIKNEKNILNSHKDKIKCFLDKLKKCNFQNPEYIKEIKNIYNCYKTQYEMFENKYHLSYQ